MSEELKYYDMDVIEEQEEVEVIETVDVIEVSDTSTYTIDSAEAFPALGESNENLKHQLLNGRELSDQHPITAITGLREELDNIKILDTVYSNKKNQADYYLWEDENPAQENRIGFFISLCEDTNKIKICSGEDIFGVVIDSAAFIGGQSDIARDYRYGLVTYVGAVPVFCESDVTAGDWVVSNGHGMAKKSDGGQGYKVITMKDIEGINYAIIALGVSMDQIDILTKELDSLTLRMDTAEKSILSAMNVANEAHNKTIEFENASDDAVKNAQEALDKVNTTIEKTDELESDLSLVNETATQARTIAESAAVSAEAMRKEANATANDALTNINNLIVDLKPITSWTYIDPESGEQYEGAEYLTTYIQDGLATKTEVETVETLTNDNKSAIEYNAEKIQTMISSVDKYSVGEYSQSYGLTREQAKSILKEGMIYIPTKHDDASSHSETFVGESEPYWFTPGGYYVWDGNGWIENGNSVAFFSEEPTPSRVLQYWYIDSNNAPTGYEAHALYIWKDEQWTQVNILDGNVNNRITSMIRQTTNEISAEVVNARGSYTGLDARLTNVDSQLQLATFWNNPDDGKSNLAAVKLNVEDDNSDLALVVMSQEGEQVLSGASIILGANNNSTISLSADSINFTGASNFNKNTTISTDGVITTQNIIAEGGKIGGCEIENNVLKIKNVNIAETLTSDMINANGISATDVDLSGKITADNGFIGGWEISENLIGKTDGFYGMVLCAGNASTNNTVLAIGQIDMLTDGEDSLGYAEFRVTGDGRLYATNAYINGEIKAISGNIGGQNGWIIDGTKSLFYSKNQSVYLFGNENGKAYVEGAEGGAVADSAPIAAQFEDNIEDLVLRVGDEYTAKFGVGANGKMYSTDANISGTIKANAGNIGGWNIDSTKMWNDAETVYFYPEYLQVYGDNFSAPVFWLDIARAGNVVSRGVETATLTISGKTYTFSNGVLTSVK